MSITDLNDALDCIDSNLSITEEWLIDIKNQINADYSDINSMTINNLNTIVNDVMVNY